jgi:HlyD family secretion protein
MKSKFIWIIVILIGVASVGTYFWIKGKNADKVEYRFEKIDRGDISVNISATGTLSAVTTVQVGTQITGTIAKLYADYNSIVKEGDLLAQLDPTFLQASVNVQRANVDRSKAQLQESQRNFDRTKELLAKQMVSQVDMDAATTDLQSAQASLRQVQASLDQAEVNLKYATIKTPISGVVISRNVDVGQTVSANLSAPTLFQIANDLSKMQIQASVDEADIGQAKVGQDVSFRVDAYPDDEFHGVLSQVRLAPVISQNVVTYTVMIDVNNPDLKLLPGMTATMTIVVKHKENILRVPLLALRFNPPVTSDVNQGVMAQTNAQPQEQQASQGDTQRMGDQRPVGDSSQHRNYKRGTQMGDSSAWQRRGEMPPPGDSLGKRRMRRFNPAGDSSANPQMKRQFAQGENPGTQNDSNLLQRPKEKPIRGKAWMMVNGKLTPVMLIRGIQDTRYAEILKSDLKEGDSVVVGSTASTTTSAQQGQNPFMPRMGGGGGAGAGGGRR